MKIRLAYRILTVLFIGFCSCFLSTTGEVQAGSIEGKVLDSSTSAPIVNLTVGAYHEDDANKLIKYAETNTTGQFTLNNLPEGTYNIVFFTYNTNYNREWYKSGDSDAYDFAAADSIPVASDPVPLENTFLQEGAKITGTVEGSNGVELAGVTARVFDIDGNWITSAATGDGGIYSLTGLNNGEYKIQFRAGDTGYASEWYNDKYTIDKADTVTISSLTDEVRNIELNTGTSISGTVRDSDGVGIVGALVKVYENNSVNSSGEFVDSPLEFGTTGEGGIYTVTGLPEGHSFKVRFFEREGDGSGAGLTEWYDNVSYFTSATTVNAGDTGIDAVLESRFNWLIFTPAIIRRPIP
ncbi:MAG: carboxypeptidase regulatory-like domain-containing protein [Candidatus Electrothrix sp. AW2]|nr:carboxypeptidase regulatory-like domain-containing protein [Candidatus Electrothrix gigas]